MTLRSEIDQILKEEFFDPYDIPITYRASNNIIFKVTKMIDNMAASSHKGFCIRTANRIKNKINETGVETSPEPKS